MLDRATFLAAAVMIAAAALPAAAQTRRGLFVGAGAGDGTARVTCGGCPELYAKRQPSFTSTLRAGATINGYVALGAELNRWSKVDNFQTHTRLLDVTGAVYVYPDQTGFFFKAGAGLSRATIEQGPTIGGSTTRASGLGLMAGGGVDIAIGRVLAVTPMVTYWRGSPGELMFQGTEIQKNVKHNVLELSVGLTLY